MLKEIKSLKKVHNETFLGKIKKKKSYRLFSKIIYLDYQDYIQEKKKENFSKTFYGRVLYHSAFFSSVYCIYKLFMVKISVFDLFIFIKKCSLNYILGRKKTIDPISRVLRWFFFLSEETSQILSSNVSFVFMGKNSFNNLIM